VKITGEHNCLYIDC